MNFLDKVIKAIHSIGQTHNPYALIDSSEVVSFDIFDTLLQRDVDVPSDLFVVLENMLLKQNISACGFAECRKKAEFLARKKYGELTNLDNIYEVLSEINMEFSKSEYKKFELDLEYKVIRLRKDIYKLYLYALEKKKHIFLISDMYLPEKVIRNLLAENGIKGYERLFVSCEYGVSKQHGDLFDLVSQETHISFVGWLHIGDNIVADWLVPMKKGILAYNVDSKPCNLHGIIEKNPSYSFEVRQMYKYIQNRVYGKDDYHKIGYSVFGPILYGVTKWVHQRAEKDNVDVIFFAARDGYLFEKAYEQFFAHKEARYLLVSRKSLMLPILSIGVPFDLYLKLFFPNLSKVFSIEKFLTKLGFSEAEISNFCIAYDYKCRQEYRKNAEGMCEFQEVYNHIKIFFKDKLHDTMMALCEYLNMESLKDKKIAVFDLGWRGTTQKCLEIILEKEIHGYYLYTDKSVYDLKYAQGYIGNSEYDVRQYDYMISLLELVFSAPHGSVKSYILSEEGSVVIYDKYEHMGKCDYLDDIRKAALTFYTDAMKDQDMFIIDLSSKDYFYAIKLIGEKPSEKLISLMGDFHFSDEAVLTLIPKKHGGCNIFSILKDYRLSYWKVGFLYSRFRLLGKIIPLGKLFVKLKIFKYKMQLWNKK